MRMTAETIVNNLLEYYGPELPPDRAGGPEDMWRPPHAALGHVQPMDYAPRPGAGPEQMDLLEPEDLQDQPPGLTGDPALDAVLGKDAPGVAAAPPPAAPPPKPEMRSRFTWTPPPGHDM